VVRKPVRVGGKSYIYYVCRSRKEKRGTCAGGCRIREDRLLFGVWETISAQSGVLGGPAARAAGVACGDDRGRLLFLLEKIVVHGREAIELCFRFRDEYRLSVGEGGGRDGKMQPE